MALSRNHRQRPSKPGSSEKRPQTSASTRWAAVVWFLFGLASPLPAADTEIVIGSKAFPESRLLAEIMAQLIEAKTTLRVQRKHGLGGTKVCFEALRRGEIDIYPEYTGTGLLSILGAEFGTDRSSDAIYELVSRRFADEFDLKWLPRFGFNNSYVLATRPEIGVTKISELRRVQETIRARFQHEFMQRADGYPGLQKAYGLDLQDVQGMEHGLAYVALSNGQVDLLDAYATDGMLKLYDVVLLEDDLQFFPPYDAAPVVRVATLARHPRLESLLMSLGGRIEQSAMVAMNYEVIKQKRPIARVASEFLLAQDLIDADEAWQPNWYDAVAGFLRMLGQHLFLTLTATLAATAVGISTGLLVARYPEKLAGPVLGLVGVLQTIPSLAMLAFMIPLLGIGTVPAITALFLYGLLPIVRNTYTGITSVPAELKEAGRGMGMTSGELLWHLELPLATKTITAGVRTALVISVGTATLGAFIGAGGFGDPINIGLQQRDNTQILLGAIPAALLALACDWLMAMVERRIGPKGL